MSTVLVTGARGQLGRAITELSQASDLEFLFTDVDELDLRDSAQIRDYLERHPVEYIVNCAAYTQVDKAEEEATLAQELNSSIVDQLYRAVRQRPGTRLIHLSTDYVFTGDLCRPLREDDPTGPRSVYGKTKLEGEQVLSGRPEAMIIRTSWLYSAHGNNFVSNMTRRMEKGQDLGVVYDQVGCPTWAGDLARTILDILEGVDRGETSFVPGIFHYANEGVCSWFDLCVEIRRLTGFQVDIRPIETHEYPLPAERPAFSVLNKNKIREVYGVKTPHWRDSLEICIKQITQRNEQQ
jgi:dTDP-4-dehydrorhamnose reductase